MVNLGDVFPNFKALTTHGEIKFHEWLGGSWAVFFSHPHDFTPVCTTELALVAKLLPEFQKRGVKLIALSCNDLPCHNFWIKDLASYAELGGADFPYPIISDENRELAVQLGMIDPAEKDKEGMPLTCRAVFVIGPDKTLKLSMLYPATTGRNFDELLRAIDSLQLTETKKVATPANWKPGGDCMVLPTVKPEEFKELFPKGVRIHPMPSKKDYMRFTPQP
uniref:1-Cys peroxiredoxin n=1 Tax=Hemiscolopendra marginata TaxID=943146 RepID=A0A646QD42_9MYRI